MYDLFELIAIIEVVGAYQLKVAGDRRR